MKSMIRFACAFWSTVLSLGAMAQQFAFPVDSAISNPLAHPREISGNREIALIYDEVDDQNDYKVRHKIFDVHQLNVNDLNPNIALQTNYPVYSAAPDNNNNRQIGSCSGDFNGNGIDDYVTGTEGPFNEIILRSYYAQPFGAQMSVVSGGSAINVGHLTQAQGNVGFIRLAAGNFDSNPDDEVVLLFREDISDVLQITIYDFDAGMNMFPVGTISDEAMPIPNSFESFDLQVVDLDYDETYEIIIAASQVVGGSRQPFVKVYDVSMPAGAATLIPREKTYVPTTVSGNSMMTIALTTGDFNGDFIEEIALAYGYIIPNNNGNQHDTFLRLFRVGDDIQNTPGAPDWLEKTILLPSVYSSVESVNFLTNLDLDAGDLNQDGKEDIILGNSTEITMIQSSADFVLTASSPLGGSYSNAEDVYYNQFITVGDMNNDGKAEVLNVRNWINMDEQEQHFSIRVHRWNQANLSWVSLAQNDFVMPLYYGGNTSTRRYSAVIGDFDGDNIMFGDYTHHVFTDVVQPIIILNAPPTHSDEPGDEWRDVNGIWEPGSEDCMDYTATYEESQEQSFSVQTTIGSDWSVSATLSAEFSGLVASASASLTASYGESYSNSTAQTTTTTEVTTNVTCFDDYIFASVITYDVYEYPLYVGDDLICYVVSVHPRMDEIEYEWFQSKSDMGQYFVTQHEPGHLLSYRPFDSPQFSFADGDAFSSSNNNVNITANSSQSWQVTTSENFETSADMERTIGLEASVSAGAFGVTAEVSGSYNWSEMSTHTSSVGQDVMVGMSVGGFPISSGDAEYSIRPYVFWGPGNEVVLDYAVEADDEYYTQNYSIQDPAWNMPWRLDENRGYDFSVQTKTRQSKSIWFDNNFAQAGDTLMVNARVFNYSLVATESPVEVKFFFGNPYNGGVPVADLNGAESVTTDGPIAAQQYKDVQFEILLPEEFTWDGRLYARIDPDSVMTEVHEENNLSWRWLGPFFPIVPDDYEGTPVSVQEYTTADAFVLYPNPAQDQVVVMMGDEFTGRQATIEVRDLGGRLVHSTTVRPGDLPTISLQGMAGGMYLVTVAADGQRRTQRLTVR